MVLTSLDLVSDGFGVKLQDRGSDLVICKMSVFASLRNVPKILATRNVRRVIPIRRSHDDV